MNARPLKVLFAIEDRQTLRHCARLLTAFGQHVNTAASPELAMARWRADRPDLLVVGGRQESALAQLRAAVADDPQHQTFKLLLVNDPTSDDLLKGLEAGADDLAGLGQHALPDLGRERLLTRFGRRPVERLPGARHTLGLRFDVALLAGRDRRIEPVFLLVELGAQEVGYDQAKTANAPFALHGVSDLIEAFDYGLEAILGRRHRLRRGAKRPP